MNYKWVFFDADDTLFHFDSYSGLKKMFQNEFAVDFSIDDFHKYQLTNKQLWNEYQNGKVNARQIKEQRFSEWGKRLNVSPHELNTKFLTAMADICETIDGAESLLKKIHGKSKIGIITNGFTDLQDIRLERTSLKKYFDVVIISEEVGHAKPDIRIFQHTLNRIGNPQPSEILMVGDNPESDIVGGISAGFDTCWLNRSGKEIANHIKPNYIVSSLYQLEVLFSTI